MSKIVYKEANVKVKKSMVISSDESANITTATDDVSDSISLELGIMSTTANEDSWKVKESNTMSSTT